MPLIDVVFLLLTFFIYAMVVLVEVKTSGLALASAEGGEQSVDQGLTLLVLDGAGRVQIDGQIVPDDELDERLAAIASDPAAPPLVLTLEDVEGQLDRGPVFYRLLDRIRRSGIEDVRLPRFEGQ